MYCYGFCSDNGQPFLLQVQSDHYDEYFAPELDKHGYNGLFKRKTTEVVAIFLSLWLVVIKLFFGVNLFTVGFQVSNGNTNTIDGCATFFRRDRFSHVKKYEVGNGYFAFD